MKHEIKPSVIDQLKTISKNFQDLEFYSYDVDGDDPTDAIFYSKLQDQLNNKIKEMELTRQDIKENSAKMGDGKEND